MLSERGQATIEWLGALLVVVLMLVAVGSGPYADGDRALGGLLAHRLVCAVKGDCGSGDRALGEAYGERDALLVREHLPGLVFEPGEKQVPVDWRRCRERACADAPDDPSLDVHRTDAGARATVFTRVVRRRGRLYIQYWTYYPDSNTTFARSDLLWKLNPALRLAAKRFLGSDDYPGFHRDDWEATVVRIGRGGEPEAKVTSHGHWQWCKYSRCRDRWGKATGWTRVSRGSHAGHVPLDLARERTSTPDGIRLVPLESVDRARYRRFDPDIAPPWEKESYVNPESSGS